MTARQFAVVYDLTTKRIHRRINCDDDPDDRHLDVAEANLQPGEAMVRLPVGEHPLGQRTLALLQPIIEGLAP